MDAPYDLQRFVEAQAAIHDAVMRELRAGRKTSHWMWFVFPQIAGLGASSMAQRFAIRSLGEAKAYLDHAVLGVRLVAATEIVNGLEGRSAHAIFSTPDDLKFRSCMTLFSRVENAPSCFQSALAKYFDGEPDAATLARL